jgi:hypothetical protein
MFVFGLVTSHPPHFRDNSRKILGNTLFETPTCVNGGKSPHWNRTVNSYLPDEVESIYLQIFDEVVFLVINLIKCFMPIIARIHK